MFLLFAITTILIFLFLIFTNYKKTIIEDKCEDIVYDPQTLERIPITTDRGHQLFKYKMIYYFNRYLRETKNDWNYVLPTEFNQMNKDKIFILDVRKPEDYKRGHIKNSLNIFWLDLMKPENLEKIPKDKEIIIVCYVGHTASQVLVLLKLLGYNARVLKFGMGKSPTMGVPVAGWIDYGFGVEK